MPRTLDDSTVRGHITPHRRSSSSGRVSRTARTSSAAYAIICGAEAAPARVDPTSPYPRIGPPKYIVPMLPLPLDERESLIGAREAKRSTGCGARIYSGAIPGGAKTWVGRGGTAGPSVVSLPEEYLSPAQNERLGDVPRKDECGCVTVGVGCAVCGNALGALTTPCEKHVSAAYTFLAEAVSPPLPRRRKIPIVIEQERTPPVDRERAPLAAPRQHDPFDLAAWLSQSYERRRAQSPARSELEEIGAQMDAEAVEAGARRAAARARFVSESPQSAAGSSAAQRVVPATTYREARAWARQALRTLSDATPGAADELRRGNTFER
ncbi:hypothetical protein FB451DRAFT_1571093 [Mycena latifolia]|nr:hypothetical protein FB451DRAFT_1571093 [Mycena latifolia]